MGRDPVDREGSAALTSKQKKEQWYQTMYGDAGKTERGHVNSASRSIGTSSIRQQGRGASRGARTRRGVADASFAPLPPPATSAAQQQESRNEGNVPRVAHISDSKSFSATGVCLKPPRVESVLPPNF